MTVLVTGATGLVGNNVVRCLASPGHGRKIRCLVRPGSSKVCLHGLPVDIVEGDVTNASSVAAAMEGVSHVVHAAALVHVGRHHRAAMREVNERGAAIVAAAARKASARLVHISTADTLRGAALDDIPYVSTKRAGENAVRAECAAGLDAVIVNPALVLGPYDWKPSSGRIVKALVDGWIPFAPRGDTSICDARDVAMAIVETLESGASGKSYPLPGHGMPWIDALRGVAAAAGRPPPLCRFDPVAHRLVGRAGDLIAAVTGREPALNSAVMRLANRSDRFDGGPAATDLAFANRPAEQTFADTCRWFADKSAFI